MTTIPLIHSAPNTFHFSNTAQKIRIDDQYDRFDALKAVSKERYCTRFIELDNYGYVWKDRVYQQLLSELPPSTLTWQMLLADYVANFPRHCIAFPHLEDMLYHLTQQQIALGIITNGYHDFQLANIQALGIAHYFDVILISESQGIKKPNPAIFLRALEKLHVTPLESVFIGDHPLNDVQAAKQVGMKGILKTDAQQKTIEADAVLTDYTTLLAMLTALFN